MIMGQFPNATTAESIILAPFGILVESTLVAGHGGAKEGERRGKNGGREDGGEREERVKETYLQPVDKRKPSIIDQGLGGGLLLLPLILLLLPLALLRRYKRKHEHNNINSLGTAVFKNTNRVACHSSHWFLGTSSQHVYNPLMAVSFRVCCLDNCFCIKWKNTEAHRKLIPKILTH